MKQELMIPVEQTVRPIFASLERKMRMREELYSLLHDHWQTALTAGRSDNEAVSEAIAAFGAPAEIRKELQASVPVIERATYGTAIRFFSTSQAPSIIESARVGACNALLIAGFLFPSLLFLAWFRGPGVLLISGFMATLSLFYGFNASLATWLGGRTVADLENRYWLRACLQSALGAMAFAASYWLLTWGYSDQGLTTANFMRLVGGGVSYLFVYLMVCDQIRKERLMTRQWLFLTLSN